MNKYAENDRPIGPKWRHSKRPRSKVSTRRVRYQQPISSHSRTRNNSRAALTTPFEGRPRVSGVSLSCGTAFRDSCVAGSGSAPRNARAGRRLLIMVSLDPTTNSWKGTEITNRECSFSSLSQLFCLFPRGYPEVSYTLSSPLVHPLTPIFLCPLVTIGRIPRILNTVVTNHQSPHPHPSVRRPLVYSPHYPHLTSFIAPK